MIGPHPPDRAHLVAALAAVLVDCVDGGASVSFLWPFDVGRATAFWEAALDAVDRGERLVVVAEEPSTGEVVGTVQVVFAVPENQPHRADLAKMLVHRRGRNRGVGAALLAAAEQAASAAGRTLLVLDTSSPAAMRLYERHGWQRVGTIPDYALTTAGEPEATVVYFKRLGP